MADKHTKGGSTLYVTGELQRKTMRYHHTPSRMAKIHNIDDTKYCQGCAATENLTHCWWECKTVQPLRRAVWHFLRKLSVDWPYSPAVALFGIYLGELNNCLHKALHVNVYVSFICNHPKQKATKIPFYGEVYKRTIVYPHNGLLFGDKK